MHWELPVGRPPEKGQVRKEALRNIAITQRNIPSPSEYAQSVSLQLSGRYGMLCSEGTQEVIAMTAQRKRDMRVGALVALLVVLAVAARAVTRVNRDVAYFLPVSLLRSFIYIGLMTWWGVSIRQRIVQTQARQYLMAIALLCVFWLDARTVKFFFAASPAAIRCLWYSYYFPMLFIPLLSVLVALSLGKPENYRLPRWTNLLYIPPSALLLLVLTNDLHQLVFAFPPDAAVWLDTDHTYGAG